VSAVERRGALAEAWRFYRSHPGAVLRVTALAYGGVVFVSAVFLAVAGPFGLIPAVYLWIASIYWLQAPLARVVEDTRSGQPSRRARETLQSVYSQLGRITGASALAALAVVSALAVFFPFALYLLTRWSLLVPVIAVESTGLFTAFSRSNEIVRGHAWRVFGRIATSVLILLGALLLVGIATGIVAAFVANEWIQLAAFAGLTLLVLALTTPLVALNWTMTYYALRDVVPRDVLEERRLRGGRTLDRAWAAYKARPGRLIVLALPIALLLSAAQITLARVYGLLVVPATLIGYVWLEGVVAAGLQGLDSGTTREWLRATLGRTVPRLPALFVSGIAAGLVLAVTLPLVVGVRFVVAGAAAVADRASGFASLGRSWQLVKGQSRRAWKVVFITALMVVGVLAGFSLLAFDLPLAAYAIVAAANVVTAPYVGLAWALMHRTLTRLPTAAVDPV
jgi:hypothetical protein